MPCVACRLCARRAKPACLLQPLDVVEFLEKVSMQWTGGGACSKKQDNRIDVLN